MAEQKNGHDEQKIVVYMKKKIFVCLFVSSTCMNRVLQSKPMYNHLMSNCIILISILFVVMYDIIQIFTNYGIG